MVSFELGEELREMFFRLVTCVGQRKISSLWLSGRASERKSEGLRFDSSWGLRIFLCPTPVRRRKNISLST